MPISRRQTSTAMHIAHENEINAEDKLQSKYRKNEQHFDVSHRMKSKMAFIVSQRMRSIFEDIPNP